MSRDEPKPCKRCDGTGEEYRPDLHYSDGPWAPCIGCHGYGFQQSDDSMRHATAILAAYWRDGWPTHYRADVEVHDMNALAERDPDLPFAWATRETGSVLIFPEDMPPSGFTDDFVRRDMVNENHRFYWWDGSCLVQRSGAEVAELISMERERIRRRMRAA